MSFFLVYKEDPERPATAGGRVLAHGKFDTREQAERKIESMDAQGWLHVIESDGTLKAMFPRQSRSADGVKA